MHKTMRVAWASCALLASALAVSETPSGPAPNPYLHGSVQNGAAKAGVCLACHGMNGNSTNPEWPVLAGQSAVYIAEQLRLFRAGVRTNPTMQPMAAMLKDADIDDLAVYYAAQTPAGRHVVKGSEAAERLVRARPGVQRAGLQGDDHLRRSAGRFRLARVARCRRDGGAWSAH